jgi:hypothetical protein
MVKVISISLAEAGRAPMDLKKEHILTQDELGELAPIDQVEERVEAEMKKLESEAKQQVADGLQDPALAREAGRLREEAERMLKETNDLA